MAQLVKVVDGLAIASVKVVNDLAIASVKTIDGLDNTSGGGASAFTLVQTNNNSNDGAGVASVTMGSNVTAGNLIAVFVKWETPTANLTGITENGGAMTLLTPQTQSDVEGVWAYKLSATGGGTSISLSWSGSPTFTRAIVVEFDYGGTATFVTSVNGGAESNPGSGTIETADATNSGTHRLNVAGAALYSGVAPTNQAIGGTTGFGGTPGTGTNGIITTSDTHAWWGIGNLAGGANDDAQCEYGTTTMWAMQMACFAAN